MVNAIKRQNTLHRRCPPPVPFSDPLPGDAAKQSFDIECLTVVVNVLEVQLKCALGV